MEAGLCSHFTSGLPYVTEAGEDAFPSLVLNLKTAHESEEVQPCGEVGHRTRFVMTECAVRVEPRSSECDNKRIKA